MNKLRKTLDHIDREIALARAREARKAYEEARKALVECPHEILPCDKDIREKLKKNKWASTGAWCPHCERHFGWWCPDSPSGECDYEQPDGTYNDDLCKYCGMPEERK
jgi:hypothetical protein